MPQNGTYLSLLYLIRPFGLCECYGLCEHLPPPSPGELCFPASGQLSQAPRPAQALAAASRSGSGSRKETVTPPKDSHLMPLGQETEEAQSCPRTWTSLPQAWRPTNLPRFKLGLRTLLNGQSSLAWLYSEMCPL